MNNRARAIAGFTLIEVLVALAILSISLAVLLQVFSVSLDRTRESQAEAAASSLAQSLLAEVGTEVSLRPGDTSGDSGGGYHWRLLVEPYGTADDLKAWPTAAVVVTATVLWDDERHSVTVTTLRLSLKDSQ